jgi:hypothetical protein
MVHNMLRLTCVSIAAQSAGGLSDNLVRRLHVLADNQFAHADGRNDVGSGGLVELLLEGRDGFVQIIHAGAGWGVGSLTGRGGGSRR